MVEGKLVVGQKIKVQDVTEITLPNIPDTVVTMEDMLKKFPKLRFSYHDVRAMQKNYHTWPRNLTWKTQGKLDP
jgi:hypothetical protein